jgi:hypothetical protein
MDRKIVPDAVFPLPNSFCIFFDSLIHPMKSILVPSSLHGEVFLFSKKKGLNRSKRFKRNSSSSRGCGFVEFVGKPA